MALDHTYQHCLLKHEMDGRLTEVYIQPAQKRHWAAQDIGMGSHLTARFANSPAHLLKQSTPPKLSQLTSNHWFCLHPMHMARRVQQSKQEQWQRMAWNGMEWHGILCVQHGSQVRDWNLGGEMFEGVGIGIGIGIELEERHNHRRTRGDGSRDEMEWDRMRTNGTEQDENEGG
ncbi:hypothetical protein K438DRAFT_1765315 [Mycena galopus ATCC 62051]|nr:hypothetical protein K438DRAFT_1765315 [Mycena galopus ATCC 62051]